MRNRPTGGAICGVLWAAASLAACAGMAHANDLACDAEVVGALPYVPVSANGATATDDIDTRCNTSASTSTRKGLWYRYNATSNTGIFVNETSGNDAAMAVFVGPDCNSLTEIHCSDDPDGIGFPVTAGQSYWVLVGVWSTTANPTTPYALTFNELPAPANDNACTAEAITSGGNSLVDARSAGGNPPVASCGVANSAFGTRHAIWYSYSTNSSPAGTLNVNETSGSSVVMQLFSGPDCNSLTTVACSIAQNSNFQLADNTNYWLSIGFNDLDNMPAATGSYNSTFTVTPAAGACCNAGNCTVALETDCVSGGGSWLGAFTTCDVSLSSTAYNSTDAFPATFPDNTPAGITRTLTISGTGQTIDTDGIAVTVDMTHTWVGDIILTISNGAVTADLSNRIGLGIAGSTVGDSANFRGAYTFLDQTTNDIWAAAAVNADTAYDLPLGQYRASTTAGAFVDLGAAFNGQPLDGTWTISISDNAGIDTGTLNGFRVQLAKFGDPPCSSGPTPCEIADFNGAGGVTADDIFAFLDAWFAQNGQSGPALTADANGDDTVTADDIFFFLDLWFTYNGQTCP